MDKVLNDERSRQSKPPTASVLLPVYNAEEYLEDAIESVLSQTFSDFELLLLDDGSTDGSSELLQLFANRDARCKIYSWPNQGLIGTLNAGLRLANAALIIRMDADDICRPQRFESQISYMQQHPECVAVGTRVVYIDAEGMPIVEAVQSYSHEEIEKALLAATVGIAHPTAIIRRSALEEIGGYRPSFPHAEDLDLFLRLTEIGRLANIPEVLLAYRQHVKSVSYQHSTKQLESATRAIRDAYTRRGITFGNSDMIVTRPGVAETKSEVHRKWAWWALRAGHVRTSRKHARRALWLGLLDFENWRVFACSVRGY